MPAGYPAQVPREHAGSRDCFHAADCFAAAWLAGLLSAFLGYVIPALLITGTGIVMLRCRIHRRMLTAAVIGMLLGMTLWTGYDRLVKQPVCALSGTDAVCTGRITDAEHMTGDRFRYTLRTKIAGHRMSLDWYADSRVPVLQIGDTVTLDAGLSVIEPDYRHHTAAVLAGQGRYLRIYRAELLDTAPGGARFDLHRLLHAYRTNIRQRIFSRLNSEEAGMLCAMLFGDKSVLTDETALALYRSGIGHITAVSGLHLVFFCTVIEWIMKRLQCPAQLIFWLMLPAIALFIMLVDSSVSVYRAAFMVLLSRAGVLFRRHPSTMRSLALAAVVCTACSPYVIGSASFWLSVSGVLGIGVVAPAVEKRRKRHTLSALLSLICVSVTVFPASMLLSGESSLLSPLCNLLILPMSVLALLLGFVYLLTGGVMHFLLPVCGLLCKMVRVLAETAGRLPFSHLDAAEPAVRVVAVLCAAILVVMLLLRVKPKMLGIAVCCTGILLLGGSVIASLHTRSQLRIAVLGQPKQAAAVISCGGSAVIADLTGNIHNAQFVRRYCTDAGIDSAEVLLLSAGRNAAAYQAALSDCIVKNVMLCEPFLWRESAGVLGCEPVLCTSEQTVGTAHFTVQRSGDILTVTAENGLTVRFLPDTAETPSDADVTVRYGGSSPHPEDKSAVCINPAAEGNDLLLIISDGVTVRSLERSLP